MILGNWKVDEDEEEFYFSMDLQKLDLQENQRREAGWIILEGLVHLGNQWMGSRLSLIFKLLNVSSIQVNLTVCVHQRYVQRQPLAAQRPPIH